MKSAINLKKWINENRHLLKPPVGNKLIWEDAGIIVTVVGGPNQRNDYHVNHGEEFFYQIEGNITVKIIENGQPKDIHINEGEVFLLPSNIPHSPQRPSGTIGLVIEERRGEDEKDGFQWYCEKCNHLLYEEYVKVSNIVTQLPQVFEHFYNNEANRRCSQCGHVTEEIKKSH